jgi:hypothetical protein
MLVATLGHVGCAFDAVEGSGNVISQSVEEEPFTRIRLETVGAVTLSQGSTQSVAVTTDDNILEELDFYVIGDTLVIEERRSFVWLDPTVLDIKIQLPELEGIVLEGSGRILTEGSFQAEELEVELSGSGEIELAASASVLSARISGSGQLTYIGEDGASDSSGASEDALEPGGTLSRVDAEISGSGNLTLSGAAEEAVYRISGSGNIDAEDLSSSRAKVDISGSGSCRLTVLDQLDVTISGSGNVYYAGSPQLESSISGSGTLSSL